MKNSCCDAIHSDLHHKKRVVPYDVVGRRRVELTGDLLVAECDPASCEIVRRKLNPNWVSDQNPDEVFAYPPADGTQHHFSCRPHLDTKHRAGQPLLYHTFHLHIAITSSAQYFSRTNLLWKSSRS